MRKQLYFFALMPLLLGIAQISGCDTEELPIAAIKLEAKVVERGPNQSSLLPIESADLMYKGDYLRVKGGGRGLLDFGNSMILRIFNDSTLGIVKAQVYEDVSWEVHIALVDGGFTGKLTKPGGKATFKTPGGGKITVLGTDFVIVHDTQTGISTVGNFNGSVTVTSGNLTVDLESGNYLEYGSGEPPGEQTPLPVDFNGFEELAIGLNSPVAAIEQVHQAVVDTPLLEVVRPIIASLDISPERIFTKGSECGDEKTVHVSVIVEPPEFSPRVVVEWKLANEQGSIEMERVEDGLYEAQVGPVDSSGEMAITVVVEDAGGVADTKTHTILVELCIG